MERGVAANERLTGVASVMLLALMLIVLATTPALNELLWPHVLLGVVLIGPLSVKLASVGYRFVRYYGGSPPYVRKGPPRLALRLLAPILVVLTLLLFATGLALLVVGPEDPGPFIGLHNVTFVLWAPLFAVHAFAYVRQSAHLVATDWPALIARDAAGSHRIELVGAATLFGIIAAVAAIPATSPWTAPGVFSQGLGGPVIAGTVLTLLTVLAVRPSRWAYSANENARGRSRRRSGGETSRHRRDPPRGL